jgi:hypothetical protein
MKKLVSIICASLFLFLVPLAQAQDLATVIFSARNQVAVGKNVTVDVYINSNTTINAAQITITYPQNEFQFVSIDSRKSAFSITAEEKSGLGTIKVARGNIKALKGRNNFTSFTLKALSSSSSLSHLGYSVTDSLVMSYSNVNILAGSMVQTVQPPSQTTNTSALTTTTSTTKTSNSSSGSVVSVLSQAVKIFFNGLFK